MFLRRVNKFKVRISHSNGRGGARSNNPAYAIERREAHFNKHSEYLIQCHRCNYKNEYVRVNKISLQMIKEL